MILPFQNLFISKSECCKPWNFSFLFKNQKSRSIKRNTKIELKIHRSCLFILINLPFYFYRFEQGLSSNMYRYRYAKMKIGKHLNRKCLFPFIQVIEKKNNIYQQSIRNLP